MFFDINLGFNKRIGNRYPGTLRIIFCVFELYQKWRYMKYENQTAKNHVCVCVSYRLPNESLIMLRVCPPDDCVHARQTACLRCYSLRIQAITCNVRTIQRHSCTFRCHLRYSVGKTETIESWGISISFDSILIVEFVRTTIVVTETRIDKSANVGLSPPATYWLPSKNKLTHSNASFNFSRFSSEIFVSPKNSAGNWTNRFHSWRILYTTTKNLRKWHGCVDTRCQHQIEDVDWPKHVVEGLADTMSAHLDDFSRPNKRQSHAIPTKWIHCRQWLAHSVADSL